MSNQTIQENLQKLGIRFVNIPKPGGSYIAVNIRGNIAYVAIQFPIYDGRFYHIGRLGKEVTTEQGYEAARMAAINVLGQIDQFVGFDKLVGLNHADICYRATADWQDAPRMADGASNLFLEVLGEKGRHTRSIVGVEVLPRGFCMSLTTSFTILN